MRRKSKKIKKDIHKLLCLSMLFILGSILLTYIGKKNPYIVEHAYSRRIYPIFSSALTGISNVFPFSLGEVILFITIGIVFFCIIYSIYTMVQRRWLLAFRSLSWVLVIVTFHIFFFQISWGLNNYRQNLYVNMKIEEKEITEEKLVEVYRHLIGKVNDIRNEIPSDANGLPTGMTKNEILQNAYKGYQVLEEKNDIFHSRKVRVKKLFLSPLQSRSGYSGVFLYYAGEPTVNGMPYAFMLPFTACHEIAHQQGFASEDEANYIGYLACIYSEERFIQYSGYMSAMVYVGNALYKTNQDIYFQERKKLSKRVEADMSKKREFWDFQVSKKTADIADSVNDAFLKANNQEDGILNYGNVTKLIVNGYYMEKNKEE